MNRAATIGLQQLAAFTLTTTDLTTTAAAYVKWLGYVCGAITTVDAPLADLWQAPSMLGRRCALLHAPGAPQTLLRLVEMPAREPLAPLLGHGWNAMEVLVEDPYALADSLRGSPFRVIIPPRPLPFDPAIHAMQVIGPASELLYLTSLPKDREILNLSAARCRVDRPFIAILGGPSATAMLDFYRDQLQTPVIGASPVIVQIINDEFALPASHTVPLAIVKLPRDCLIEVDELPAAALPRATPHGEIPAGYSMVSFTCANLGTLSVPWRHPPIALDSAPYNGRRAGVTRGVAGEWIELIEAPR